MTFDPKVVCKQQPTEADSQLPKGRCEVLDHASSVPYVGSSVITLSVISFPVAADVEVDGVFYGAAGEDIELPFGTHRVRVSLPGYGCWEKQLLLEAGMVIHARLPKSASFSIINE